MKDFGFWFICTKCNVRLVKKPHLEFLICTQCHFKLTEEYLDSIPDDMEIEDTEDG